MRFLRALLCSVILAIACFPVYAKRYYAAPPLNTDQLVMEIRNALSTISGAEVGIIVKSMRNGEVLYSHNAQQLFVPASIMKVATAQAALLYLGSDFRFSTNVLTDAKSMSNGLIDGNIYLVQSGDPSLTYSDFVDLMQALKAQNIRQIKGNVYIDNSAYDQSNYGPGWIWKDKRFCFAAPINASIINHNCFSVKLFSSSKKSKRRTKTPKKNQNMILAGKNGVISDVMQNNQNLVRSLCKTYSIQITGDVLPGVAPHNAKTLASHQSKPLSNLVNRMLKVSDNIIAGSLLKKIGSYYMRRPGSWENGSAAISQILTKAGVDTNRMAIVDGSGLSIYNQITPAQMMQILNIAYHNDATNYEFISSLPIAGVDGTLKYRLRNIAYKVRAKTGTMPGSGIASLAGYAMSYDKEPLAFVIIVNGKTGMVWKYKAMEDRIVAALTRHAR